MMGISLDELGDTERPDFPRNHNGAPWVSVGGKRKLYKRSSSSGKILDDESGLERWKKRTIILGAARKPDLMAETSTLAIEQDGKRLDEIVEECITAAKGDERRNLGSAIHAMLDHVDLDHDWVPAPQFQAMVDAYTDTLEAWGLVPVDVEINCVDDANHFAGRMDRRYRTTKALVAPDMSTIPIGSILGADTKTGRKVEYAAGSFCTQIATYVGSVRYDVVTNEREPFDPPANTQWGLVMHVEPDTSRCDVYWVDLEAGREGLALAEEVRAWRRRTDLLTLGKAPTERMSEALSKLRAAHPSNGTERPPQAALTAPELAAVHVWLRERVEAIKARGERAVGLLVRTWPVEVPGLKYDTHTAEELDAISRALDKVETEFSMPFVGGDPRERMWNDPDHPRAALIRGWMARVGTQVSLHEWWTIGKALSEFAMLLHEDELWAECDVDEMLDGSIRAMGLEGGIEDLGKLRGTHAGGILERGKALVAGRALVEFVDNKPVVLVIHITNTNEMEATTNE